MITINAWLLFLVIGITFVGGAWLWSESAEDFDREVAKERARLTEVANRFAARELAYQRKIRQLKAQFDGVSDALAEAERIKLEAAELQREIAVYTSCLFGDSALVVDTLKDNEDAT